ncbi:SNF2 family N-terminal domain-containing protein [Xylariaceae sp. FL0016]|nr:SNF2 family N-terminal domain-containing protein [Xylariaceae sp. FL0016]
MAPGITDSSHSGIDHSTNFCFPAEFINCLHRLPSDGNKESNETYQPRQKRIHFHQIESIPITRQEFTLAGPRKPWIQCNEPNLALTGCAVLCKDVRRYLKLGYRVADSVLNIGYKTEHGAKGTLKSFDLDLTDVPKTPQLLACLEALNISRPTSNEEGALGVTVDIACEETPDHFKLSFLLQLNWISSTVVVRSSSSARAMSRRVLDACLGRTNHITSDGALSPQAFYQAAFMPDNKYTDLAAVTVPGLQASLYPFQRRALQWLLAREGANREATIENTETSVVPVSSPKRQASDLPLSFRSCRDVNGRLFFVSDLYHIVTRDPSPFHERIKGGILAEEMGLGKTIEVISLVSLHKRPTGPNTVFDAYANRTLHRSSATLIITPNTLKHQWLSEIEKHAPGLKALWYDGMKYNRDDTEQMLIDKFVNCDIIITSYQVLQSEVHYAQELPDRQLRHERIYERRTSPLVQISWWRLCLDEAQQIESGVSVAARVARLIPRVNAWAVTGTPVKDKISDLWGLLLFLRYDPFASSMTLFNDMASFHPDLFRSLFRRIAMRHSKAAVRGELRLPQQKRFVISMPFTPIEEQNYKSQFKNLVHDAGLDESGAPLEDNWDPQHPRYVELMRRALARLRKTVLHPELDPTMAQKSQGLRSIDEVLDTMIETAETSVKSEQRTYLTNMLKRGQLVENSPRVKEALAVWQDVKNEIDVAVTESRAELQVEIDKTRDAEKQKGVPGTDNGQSRPDEDTLDDERDHPKVGSCRRKLRSALEIQHRATFFIASAYYQIKSNEHMTESNSEEFRDLERLENRSYESAKEIRTELLQEPYSKALSLMGKLKNRAESQSFVEVPDIDTTSVYGLESRRVAEKLESFAANLNEQVIVLDEWREIIIQLLLRPLVDGEGEAEVTGDEYEDSTKVQDALMTYTLALRALICDRQDALTGAVNERVKYETSYAERQARNGEGHAPEKTLELLAIRRDLKLPPHSPSLRNIVSEFRELGVKLRQEAADGNRRAQIENEIVEKQIKLAQKQLTQHTKAATTLERDLDIFTAAMNARVEYYKQLQAVSDTVAIQEKDPNQDIIQDWDLLVAEEQAARTKATAARSQHRYLIHLRDELQNSSQSNSCIICYEEIELGILTLCGHKFCKECLDFWLKSSHKCPACKKRLSPNMLHDITSKKQKLRLHEATTPDSVEHDSPRQNKKLGIYSDFHEAKLEAIQHVKLDGPSYGTKINTLIKHLVWLREEDPGAKSIIFSQFRGFLSFLASAFRNHGIRHVTFGTGSGGSSLVQDFKDDPSVECLLMDARAHSSGLNLVNAHHVFLCEPMVNTALELQAIARVDRIGQERDTTVWLYLVDGTVEESIYTLSVQRRLAHLTQKGKGKSRATSPEPVSALSLEEANSLELQSAVLPKLMSKVTKHMSKEQELGEVVESSDLWECLFGHVSRGRAAGGPASSSLNEEMQVPLMTPVGFLAGVAAESRAATSK